MFHVLMDTPPQDWVGRALGFGALLGGIGYAIGQFLSSRRKGIADSLATALNEIEAIRNRADRLEEELVKQSQEMAAQKQENALLRSLVTGGEPFLKAIERTRVELESIAREEHAKTRALIERIRKEESPHD